jgi:hypothetical protein
VGEAGGRGRTTGGGGGGGGGSPGTGTGSIGPGGTIVTTRSSCAPAALSALIVTSSPGGTPTGAVYAPSAPIVPACALPPATPSTFQVSGLSSNVRVALSCAVVPVTSCPGAPAIARPGAGRPTLTVTVAVDAVRGKSLWASSAS